MNELREALIEADRMLIRANVNADTLFTALANECRLVGKHDDAEAIIRERDSENEMVKQCRVKIRKALENINE